MVWIWTDIGLSIFFTGYDINDKYDLFKITRTLISLYYAFVRKVDMGQNFRIYCDESCHLENSDDRVMLLGGVWTNTEHIFRLAEELRALKAKHNAKGELKWIKVSRSKVAFYEELIDWFFTKPELNFRCLVVDDKKKLDHSYFNQGSHDSFYYKMYFYLLRHILTHSSNYEIYLDIKDTRSQRKILQLKKILEKTTKDYTGLQIQKIQQIRSHESELLQFADFLLGAVSYKCRDIQGNFAKLAVIQRIYKHTGLELKSTTPPWETKFNIFVFTPAVRAP